MKRLARMLIPRRDMASCIEVMRMLNAYLDGEIEDPVTARRIAAHLHVCERCGMKAEMVTELKTSLRRLEPQVDPDALERLRSFARSLNG